MFKAKDGTLMVLDNKSADVKDDYHPSSAAYRAQVNFYAYMLLHAEMAQEVSGLACCTTFFADDR